MKHTPLAFALTLGGITLMTAAILIAAPEQADFPIPMEELDARRMAIFVEADGNGDGLISMEEFMAQEAPGHRRRHKGHGDHPYGMRAENSQQDSFRRNPAELDEQMFSALDTDGDGVLSRLEFSHQASHQAEAEARRSFIQERLFARLDSNDDGYLSTDEFPPNRFAMLDTDGNREISRDELRHRHTRPDAD